MAWILVDVALVVLALGLLVRLALALRRRVTRLTRSLGVAGDQLTQLSVALDADAARSFPAATSAGPLTHEQQTSPGVRSHRSS